MNRLACIGMMLLAGVSLPALAQGVNLAGDWQGALTVPGGKLRLVLHIARDAKGGYTGTLDSPDQGARGIPLSAVTVNGNSVKVEVDAVKGEFNGELSKDGKSIVGMWGQGGATLPLTLTRSDKPIEGPKRPQEPKAPFPYLTREVTYPNPAAPGVTLAGTLTLPKGAGPFPAVLLITGSGPQDRNETIFGHKPFWVIADYLTRRGIAVLRVDDRGVGKSTGDSKDATSRDFASDALAGVRYLRACKDINKDNVGLIGHSEGGIIAPMVAVDAPKEVAFIVLLAGTGMPGDQLILLQSEKISRASGMSEAAITKNLALTRQLIAIIKQEPDNAKAEAAMRQAFTEAVAHMTPEELAVIGNPDQFIQGQVTALLSPWMRFFLTYDPLPTLAKVRCPILALNGENDLQVPYKENLAGILSALSQAVKDGARADYTIKSLPALNHLFQTSKTGSPAEYAEIEETVSPAALRAMGDWLLVGK